MNLQADPHELTDLVGLANFRAVADDLRDRLIRRMVAAGEAVPIIEAAPVRTVIQRALTSMKCAGSTPSNSVAGSMQIENCAAHP